MNNTPVLDIMLSFVSSDMKSLQGVSFNCTCAPSCSSYTAIGVPLEPHPCCIHSAPMGTQQFILSLGTPAVPLGSSGTPAGTSGSMKKLLPTVGPLFPVAGPSSPHRPSPQFFTNYVDPSTFHCLESNGAYFNRLCKLGTPWDAHHAESMVSSWHPSPMAQLYEQAKSAALNQIVGLGGVHFLQECSSQA
ncbi:hypothetical protein CHUAL_009631 [Chamberlinius hualienensis]